MEEKLDKILSELQNTNERIGNMESSHKEISHRMKNLESSQQELSNGQLELTKGQKELTSRMGKLETGQSELTKGQRELTSRMENLETGQEEITSRMEKGYEELKAGQADIINIIKHTTSLMTENFTYIRKDMRTFQSDVNADIELLFKEVSSVKRKVNKLEQSKK